MNLEAAETPFVRDLAELIERFTATDGVQATAIPRLTLVRASHPSEPLHGVHEPAVCFVVQGRKQVAVGKTVFEYDRSKYLVVSTDVPIVGQVLEASPETPYLCLRLDLDVEKIGSLMLEANLSEAADREASPAFSLTSATPELLESVFRFVRLLAAPGDIPILAPLAEREILYRLLTSEQTAKIRQIAISGSRNQQINRAIGWIKRNFRENFSIATLAAESNMSPSVLHQHFKTVTSLSPLQYQKQLRLQEARRLMTFQGLDAANAGFTVGYESPSQFSREYRRLFGDPPARDAEKLRARTAQAGAY